MNKATTKACILRTLVLHKQALKSYNNKQPEGFELEFLQKKKCFYSATTSALKLILVA